MSCDGGPARWCCVRRDWTSAVGSRMSFLKLSLDFLRLFACTKDLLKLNHETPILNTQNSLHFHPLNHNSKISFKILNFFEPLSCFCFSLETILV
ncbi:hypothetical protein VNO80_26340 [Phaseolus coccineus]|uniref:Uncharacterized protein n=1 Tax=Phaseolus coccineus TaxID=3886 RepID=A0AAN9QEA4_PHACN